MAFKRIGKNRVLFFFLSFTFNFSLSFLPEAQGAISERQFHTILDKIERLYSGEVLRVTGRRLLLGRLWSENQLWNVDSAQQHPQRETADVTITSLLAKHPLITTDAFALMVCHEFGHHLGGEPRQPQTLVAWSSVEGQADYWGVLHCLRRYLQGERAVGGSEARRWGAGEETGNSLPPFLREKCQGAYDLQEEREVCFRSVAAAWSMAQYFNATSARHQPIEMEQRDPLQVNKTKSKYGSPQCRWDSFLAASLCRPSSSAQGDCEGDEEGQRPRCWFAP